MRVGIDEIPALGELRRCEYRCARVAAAEVGVVLVRHSAVEHGDDRMRRAGHERHVAWRARGGELPGLRVCRAADEDAIRLGGGDGERGAERVEHALERSGGRQDRELEVPQPEIADDRAHQVEGGRAQRGEHRCIAAHDQLLRCDDLRQAVDDLRGGRGGPGRAGQRCRGGDRNQHSGEVAHRGTLPQQCAGQLLHPRKSTTCRPCRRRSVALAPLPPREVDGLKRGAGAPRCGGSATPAPRVPGRIA